MHTGPELSLSPSFNSYSNYNLAEIAARVVEEFSSFEEFYDEFCIENKENSSTQRVEEESNSESVEKEDKNDDEDEDEEFEFAFVAKEAEFSSPISADEIFYNGQIRPTFPISNRDLRLRNVEIENGNKTTENSGSSKAPRIRVPLRKLFIEERETTTSSSSSETDELENLPPGTYCVWKPKEKAAAAARQCKKSSSAGSSKRWKFSDLLHRTNSDGRKDSFVFLPPRNKQENKKTETAKVTPPMVAAVASGTRKGDERRRDVVGFFNIVNGLSRNLQPF